MGDHAATRLRAGRHRAGLSIQLRASCVGKQPGRAIPKMSDNLASSSYIELAADIVSAYVSNNSVPSGDLPSLISDVHVALTKVGGGAVEAPAEAPKPAISVKKSVTPD